MDRMANLHRAEVLIDEVCGRVVARSGIYETAAWGPVPQPAYLNQVLKVYTAMGPVALLKAILGVEATMGRVRETRYGPRIIDVDILFFNNLVLDTEALTVPHPRLHARRFVLQPLCDVAPLLVHPVLGLTVQQLLADCPDTLDVKKIIGPDGAE